MAYGKSKGYGNPAPNRSFAKASNFEGYRCIPTGRSPSMKSSSKKMSSAHGCTSGNATKGMTNASNRIGADKKGFKSGPIVPRPKKID